MTSGRVHATGQEIEVGYDSRLPFAIGCTALAAGVLTTALAVAASGAAALLCLLLTLGSWWLVVGAAGTLWRRPRVLLTADSLDYRGWSVDASVAWDDIEGTAIDERFGARPLAEVLVVPTAPSLRRSTTALGLPEPLGTRPRIRILARGLHEPALLLAYVDDMARRPAAERGERLGASGLAFLLGSGG